MEIDNEELGAYYLIYNSGEAMIPSLRIGMGNPN
jgi:hypothetical protein